MFGRFAPRFAAKMKRQNINLIVHYDFECDEGGFFEDMSLEADCYTNKE
jgi:hypothetical protein